LKIPPRFALFTCLITHRGPVRAARHAAHPADPQRPAPLGGLLDRLAPFVRFRHGRSVRARSARASNLSSGVISALLEASGPRRSHTMTNTKTRALVSRQLAGILLFAAVATMSASTAQAAIELIPSIGITKSTDDNAGDARGFGGLAIRAPLMPFLKAEGGIGYRQDSFASGDIKVRQWPVTASLWLAPFPMIYAGGGIGWYRTTLDYREELPFEDSTDMTTGLHLGGGVNVPMAPRLGLDFNGRYIFMQGDNDNVQIPTTFNPDFWSTSLGLAISF
jgi:hypothetical protein